MKPILLIPPGTISAEDIKLLRENDICVVVAKDPAKVKFVDPIPAASSRTQIEGAAIMLSRKLLAGQWGHITAESSIGRNTFARLYVECLVAGTPLDPNPTIQEQEQQYFDDSKLAELERLAKEEAKSERAKAKAKAAAK